MANVPNQWNKTQPAQSSWATNSAVPSNFSSSALPADNFSPVTGLTRYSLYNDPLVGYSQVFPYNGGIVAIVSQYQNGGIVSAAPPSSWSTQ